MNHEMEEILGKENIIGVWTHTQKRKKGVTKNYNGMEPNI